MPRRQFLHLLLASPWMTAAGLYGCSAQTSARSGGFPTPPRAQRRAKIQGICFDLFTLFDPRSVTEVARNWIPEGSLEFCDAWRSRQFEYSWLRAAAGQYVDFRQVTQDALDFAAKARGLKLSEQARHTLIEAYSRLEPWPDTRAALLAWKQAGLRLAPLANYSPPMLEELIANAALTDMFDAQISTDRAKAFKPDPRAYQLGVSSLRLEREQIAFSAFGGWDAAGAKWFGFPTFWVNRLGVPEETLAPGPDGTGPTLKELASFVSGW